jgi:hypothetical protein
MRPSPISTLNQSIPFHLKRSFWRSDFSPLISSKPLSPQDTEHRKREREKRKKKYWKKEKKAPRVSSNKRGSQYFKREKQLQLQKFFFIWFHFLPLHHTNSKTFSNSLRKFS